jgi:sec-independent protein translocase protein TatA
MFGPSHWLMWVVIAFFAFLMFGNRLPSVMRSLGQGLLEFKKGMADIKDESAKNPSESPKDEKSDKT